jgi:hypothetical protein
MILRWPVRLPAIIWAFILVAIFIAITLVTIYSLPLDRAALANQITGDIFIMVSAGVAVLILSRQPNNVIGRLMMFYAVSQTIIYPLTNYLTRISGTFFTSNLLLLAAWVNGWAWWLLIGPIFLIFLYFPTGKLPSPRWRWVIILIATCFLVFLFFATFYPTFSFGSPSISILNPLGWITPDLEKWLMLAVEILLLLSACFCFAAVFNRYRHALAVERTQIKWLLYACALFVVTYGLVGSFGSDNAWYGAFFNISLSGIPLAIGAAILRYRLWDIDFLIRRTLSYTVLTGLLALVYFGGVTLLQDLFSLVSGLNSTLAILISTLLIATLFNPLRRQVQVVIDRRFFRQEYNSQQALAGFVNSARNLTGLDELAAEVLQVAHQTLKPASINLWLKKS